MTITCFSGWRVLDRKMTNPALYLMACPSMILLTSFVVLARHLMGDTGTGAAGSGPVTGAGPVYAASPPPTAAPAAAPVYVPPAAPAAPPMAQGAGPQNAARQKEKEDGERRELERQKDKDRERRENERREQEKRDNEKKERPSPAPGTSPTNTQKDPQILNNLPPVPVTDNKDRTPFNPTKRQ